MMQGHFNKSLSEDEARQISAWFDGEVSPDTVAELERRCSQDSAARSEYAAVEAIDRMLGEWPAPDQTPDVRMAVLERIRGENPGTYPSTHEALRWVAGLAGGMVAGWLLLMAISVMGPDQASADDLQATRAPIVLMDESVTLAGLTWSDQIGDGQ